MKWITKLFRRKASVSEDPDTHDFTHGNYVYNPYDGGIRGYMVGWKVGVNDGDFVIIRNGDKDSSRYRIEGIEYLGHSFEMFSAKIAFHPRSRD